MIPDYQSIMLPLLQMMNDQKDHPLRDMVNFIADKFSVDENDRKELLPSGKETVLHNRVGWAKFYINKSGLIDKVKHGVYKISEDGLKYLASNPTILTVKDLNQLDTFIKFKNDMYNKPGESEVSKITTDSDKININPEEALEYSFLQLKNEVMNDLLDLIKRSSPDFFEKLVVDLIIKMGYGGSRKDAGKAIGKSGDGGIDGIIKEDKLGLDAIYLQAKRWDNTVPIKEVRDFAGALLSKKARKGIFFTTSTFSQSAYEFVNSIEHKIILIDGVKLAELMFEYNVGLSPQFNYEVKRIDSDYFEEL